MTIPTSADPVTFIDARELAARPWLPRAALVGSHWQGPDGELVRVEGDGSVSPIVRGGSPFNRSIASDASATRRKP